MLPLEENKQKIIDMYNSGLSTNKISKEFNCNSGSIYLKLQSWGIEIKKRQSFIGNIEDFKDEILEMYNSGIGSYSIAKKLNISKPTVLRLIKKYTNTRKATVDKNNLLKDKLDLVIELFETKNMTEISKITGHGEPSVFNLLKKNGYKTSKYKCKYNIDETYFEKIDTHNKAYTFGWFMSDGNVTERGKFRIQIQEEDSYILNDIKNDMKYDGELFYLKAKNERCKPQVLLNIDRQKIAQDLISLGCPCTKSLILELPSFDKVPKEFFNSFLRGFFDGDGSISLRGSSGVRCNITSTDIFCKSLSKYLKTIGIESGKFYYRNPDKPTGSMFFNKEDSIKFLNYIYKDATLKLNRKYEKALPFLLH